MRNSPARKPLSQLLSQGYATCLQNTQEISGLLKAHPYWYGLFLAFCLAFYVPARWLWGTAWGVAGTAVSWQVLVPCCVLALVWSLRGGLLAVWKRPKNRGMMGNPIFFVLGWLIYLLSLFFQGPLLAFLGLIFMTWGGIYWLFGGFIFRTLLMPFVFSFLLVPIPLSLMGKLKVLFQLGLAQAVRALLNRTGTITNLQKELSAEGNHQFVFIGNTLPLTYNSTGLGVLCVAGFLVLFYGAMRHYTFVRCLFLSLLGGVLGFLIEIVRVFIAAALYSNASSFSLWLIDLSPWWFAFLASLGAVVLDYYFLHAETRLGKLLVRMGRPFEHLARRMNKPLDIALESSARVAGRAGRAIEKSGRPFDNFADWVGKKMRPLRRMFRQSNRGVEGFLGRFDRKKRRRSKRR
jgi:Transmembrane exosortase (Exosortase_EpsH)